MLNRFARILTWNMLSMLLLENCFLNFTRPANQQLVESILSGYPHASQFTRAEDQDTMGNHRVKYRFTTTDTKQTVIDYYQNQLAQYGFVATNQAQYRNQDVDLWRGGCPVFDVGIAIDELNRKVEIVFTTSLCR